MQVTKCDRCGATYNPTRAIPPAVETVVGEGFANSIYMTQKFLNCSRLVMTNRNRDYDLCEKCTEEILVSFKGE